jgi:hypothetical protein
VLLNELSTGTILPPYLTAFYLANKFKENDLWRAYIMNRGGGGENVQQCSHKTLKERDYWRVIYTD